MVIPAGARSSLSLKEGDNLVLEIQDGSIRIRPLKTAIQEMQQYFGQCVKPGESVVDDLIRERREEAAREEKELHDESLRS